ncbi:hypothetical protein INR76_06600 [Marixanthomonas sp. SCSIO 43207]|uniref:hypothetical protein n=1 Tax=Marixanthomonas sp. SCSIO 43207 TaxID=2779360 RepID=UPI001CA9EDA0|nr:hypothetical protein [Marixanthomonas sp. SCSIO 43207]UAB82424.1 hypothetical protein INR76_06600 [Marixanthomonas sp. SCSIO 43207]
MHKKIFRLFEYVYIVMAVFSLYLVWTNWSENRTRAYLFAFFAVVAIFMFFFKRNFRKKMEERNKNQ